MIASYTAGWPGAECRIRTIRPRSTASASSRSIHRDVYRRPFTKPNCSMTTFIPVHVNRPPCPRKRVMHLRNLRRQGRRSSGHETSHIERVAPRLRFVAMLIYVLMRGTSVLMRGDEHGAGCGNLAADLGRSVNLFSSGGPVVEQMTGPPKRQNQSLETSVSAEAPSPMYDWDIARSTAACTPRSSPSRYA